MTPNGFRKRSVLDWIYLTALLTAQWSDSSSQFFIVHLLESRCEWRKVAVKLFVNYVYTFSSTRRVYLMKWLACLRVLRALCAHVSKVPDDCAHNFGSYVASFFCVPYLCSLFMCLLALPAFIFYVLFVSAHF